MKKLALLVTIICVSSLNLNGQSLNLPEDQKSGEFLMVSVFIDFGGIHHDSRLIISDGKEELKTMELEQPKAQNMIKNQKKATKVVNKVKSNGYELEETTSSGSDGMFLNNYIFKKE